MTKSSKQPWWEGFFNENFSQFQLDRENDPSLSPTVDFLISSLKLETGSLVFEQCCGTGAVSMSLGERGAQAIGIDQANDYIERAQKRAVEKSLSNVFFETADAFDYVTPQKCDAAVNWYSSFGYTEDDKQNVKMMNRVFDSLKPGGSFVMDYMNVPNLLKHFEPVYVRESEVNGQRIKVEKHTSIDNERGMVQSQWKYYSPNGDVQETSGEIRLYQPDDIVRLMKDSGFVDVSLYGGFNGEPCNADHQRCIALARTPL